MVLPGTSRLLHTPVVVIMSNPTVYGGITLLITADPALLAAKKINALIINTLPLDSPAVLIMLAKHTAIKGVGNLLLILVLAVRLFIVGIRLIFAVKNQPAAPMLLLENLPPDNQFAVGLNHPTLRLKPTAVVIIAPEAIAADLRVVLIIINSLVVMHDSVVNVQIIQQEKAH